jgi:N-acetylneuraminic acid mutarotase
VKRRTFLLAALATPAAAQWTPEAPDRPARPRVAAPKVRASIPLPRPVQEIYATVFDARIVVAGGFEAKGGTVSSLADLAPTNAVHSFRPGARKWERLPDLPLPLHHPMLVANGGRLFCIGGFSSAPGAVWRMERRVLVLARGAARWEEGPPLPRPQAEAVGAVVAGRLVLALGRTPMEAANANYFDHGDTDALWLLSPDGTAWEAGPRAPRALNSTAFGVINGRLHIVGGRYTTGGQIITTPTHQIWDGTQWREAAPMPAPRAGHAAAVIAGQLWAFGGESFEGTPTAHPSIFRYDPRTDRWDEPAQLPTPRHGLGAVGLAGRAHLIGGAEAPSGKATTARHDIFTP